MDPVRGFCANLSGMGSDACHALTHPLETADAFVGQAAPQAPVRYSHHVASPFETNPLGSLISGIVAPPAGSLSLVSVEGSSNASSSSPSAVPLITHPSPLSAPPLDFTSVEGEEKSPETPSPGATSTVASAGHPEVGKPWRTLDASSAAQGFGIQGDQITSWKQSVGESATVTEIRGDATPNEEHYSEIVTRLLQASSLGHRLSTGSPDEKLCVEGLVYAIADHLRAIKIYLRNNAPMYLSVVGDEIRITTTKTGIASTAGLLAKESDNGVDRGTERNILIVWLPLIYRASNEELFKRSGWLDYGMYTALLISVRLPDDTLVQPSNVEASQKNDSPNPSLSCLPVVSPTPHFTPHCEPPLDFRSVEGEEKSPETPSPGATSTVASAGHPEVGKPWRILDASSAAQVFGIQVDQIQSWMKSVGESATVTEIRGDATPNEEHYSEIVTRLLQASSLGHRLSTGSPDETLCVEGLVSAIVNHLRTIKLYLQKEPMYLSVVGDQIRITTTKTGQDLTGPLLATHHYNGVTLRVGRKTFMQALPDIYRASNESVFRKTGWHNFAEGYSVHIISVQPVVKNRGDRAGEGDEGAAKVEKSQTTFGSAFATVYDLRKWDKGLFLVRLAAWVTTVALGFIPLLGLWAVSSLIDCLGKRKSAKDLTRQVGTLSPSSLNQKLPRV